MKNKSLEFKNILHNCIVSISERADIAMNEITKKISAAFGKRTLHINPRAKQPPTVTQKQQFC